jgi:broad specificity phosphatase PhoE
MKALTVHGHQQAEASARFIKQLFDADKLPQTRALLHSTSRRARETAAKLPTHLQGIEVWNADMLRETDPTKNPFRAEEVFSRIFVAPPAGASDTLIVVAHNNINLYLLMRAAGVPMERAVEAWKLFHLTHASITRVDVLNTGMRQIVTVGAAGHIPKDNVTWSNISGPDLVEWTGGGPERNKLSGRTLLLVRQVAPQAELGSRQTEALAAHIRGLSEYMVSGHLTVACTPSSEVTAALIARKFKTFPQIFPDSISQEPEAAFLQFFGPPTEHKRDTVVMVAEDGPVLYWLLRSLYMTPEEAKASAALYRIGHASISIVQIKSDGTMRVVAVGDCGHIPIECI